MEKLRRSGRAGTAESHREGRRILFDGRRVRLRQVHVSAPAARTGTGDARRDSARRRTASRRTGRASRRRVSALLGLRSSERAAQRDARSRTAAREIHGTALRRTTTRRTRRSRRDARTRGSWRGARQVSAATFGRHAATARHRAGADDEAARAAARRTLRRARSRHPQGHACAVVGVVARIEAHDFHGHARPQGRLHARQPRARLRQGARRSASARRVRRAHHLRHSARPHARLGIGGAYGAGRGAGRIQHRTRLRLKEALRHDSVTRRNGPRWRSCIADRQARTVALHHRYSRRRERQRDDGQRGRKERAAQSAGFAEVPAHREAHHGPLPLFRHGARPGRHRCGYMRLARQHRRGIECAGSVRTIRRGPLSGVAQRLLSQWHRQPARRDEQVGPRRFRPADDAQSLQPHRRDERWRARLRARQFESGRLRRTVCADEHARRADRDPASARPASRILAEARQAGTEGIASRSRGNLPYRMRRERARLHQHRTLFPLSEPER
ncbi:ABC transporter ATP-binding protein [Burkholderia sp. SJ98]|nr:ABC transporter ATP-binding protein [Burkholderia sp. SJ98]